MPPFWLLALFGAVLVTGTDEMVIAGVLPTVAADLRIPVGAAGQLVTVFAVAYAIAAPLLAVLTERFRRRNVLVAGLLVFALANAGAAIAPGYLWLLVARVVAASAAGAITAAAFAIAGAAAPDGRQGRYLAVVTAGMTVALFTGVPTGSWLAGAQGWRSTFWLIAALSLVMVVGVWVSAPVTRGGPPVSIVQRLSPLRSLPVVQLVGTALLCGSGGLMFYSYLGPVTAELAGGSYRLLSVVLLVVGLTGIGGVYLGGRVTDGWGPRPARLFVIAGHGVALLAIAVLALSGTRNAVAFVLLVAVWSVFAWALNPPLQASMLQAAPAAGTAAMALVISGMYLGTGVAGGLGGVIIELADVTYLPLVAGMLLLLALVLTAIRSSTPTMAIPAEPADVGLDDTDGSQPTDGVDVRCGSEHSPSSPV